MNESRNALFFNALVQRAGVFSLIGKHKDAQHDYHRARMNAQSKAGVIASNLGLAELFLKEGKLQESTRLLMKMVRYATDAREQAAKGAILNVLCNVKILGSKAKEAERHARQAIRFFREKEKDRKRRQKGIAESWNNLGGIYSSKGQLRKALQFYERSHTARKRMGDREGMAITLNNIGVTYMDLREYDKALSFLRRSLRIRRVIGYIRGIGLCSSNMALVYWNQGKHEEAVRCAKENLKQQEMLGDKRGMATSMSNIGVMSRIRGEYRKAIEYHQKSYQLRKEMNDRFGMTINLNQMGHIFLNRGERKVAIKMNNEEAKLCRSIANEPRLMNYYGLRACILREQRKPKEAYRYRERSLEINRKLHLIIDEARDLREMADIIISQKLPGKSFRAPIQEAKKLLLRSMKTVEEKRHGFEYSIVLSRMAMLSTAEGRYERAVQQISEAERVAVKQRFREFLPEVFVMKARMLARINKKKEAMGYLERAERLSREMGRMPLLAKIKVLRKGINRADSA